MVRPKKSLLCSFMKACLHLTSFDRPVYHPQSAIRQWKSPRVWVQPPSDCNPRGAASFLVPSGSGSSAVRLLPISALLCWLSKKLRLFSSSVVDDDKTANAEESLDIIIARVLRRRLESGRRRFFLLVVSSSSSWAAVAARTADRNTKRASRLR
jgi:hypothetical protein